MIPLETFRYGVTGGANTLLDILLYYVFYHYVLKGEVVGHGFLAMSPHIAAFVLSFPITFTTGFLLARYVTFTRSPVKGKRQLKRYAITVMGAIFMNYALLKFLVEVLLIWPTPAKIITTVIVVIYSYVFQRYYTFQTGYIRRNTH